jgi:hypothetical protein
MVSLDNISNVIFGCHGNLHLIVLFSDALQGVIFFTAVDFVCQWSMVSVLLLFDEKSKQKWAEMIFIPPFQ